MGHSRIAGTGAYLPAKALTNQEIEQRIETSDEWIFSRTGIRSRFVA
ncbi:MAG: 3-oxoacyl-ACP synthase, partial [Gammaproteobacteria bacterium]|nr:3-oxoacyl-ACP synthase [Gammaproteobacteria bacterium]